VLVLAWFGFMIKLGHDKNKSGPEVGLAAFGGHDEWQLLGVENEAIE